MGKRWYGSINNRIEENRKFCKEITVGTGATEYFWSDRHAFEVTYVFDQKHVMVREYDVKATGEPMSNNWELISNPNNPEIELKFRYNSWYEVIHNKLGGKTYQKRNFSFGKAEYYYDYEF